MDHSLEDIWDKLSGKLRAFIRARIEDEMTAEDLLQEVFLRIHTRMHTLQDTDRLEAWVYQIARNVIIDHYRKRQRSEELGEAVAADENLFQEPDAAEELAGSIRALVDGLPEPYREALLLTEYEGLSQKELADRLGITVSGAKSRVQRARQKMKDELLTCCHFAFDRYGRVVDYWKHCCCCCRDCSR